MDKDEKVKIVKGEKGDRGKEIKGERGEVRGGKMGEGGSTVKKRSSSDIGLEGEANETKKHSKDDVSISRHKCKRKPIQHCSEEEFILDLVNFLQYQKKKLVPSGSTKNFPTANFNGSRLDLYNLYREVVSRGGFNVRQGINWKGQVFPTMRNHTTSNKATAVSAVLKKHYEVYLLDYERAHTDVASECCTLCHRGTEGDWVNCGTCQEWAHFQCDQREGLGAFKEYVKIDGREYICSRCEKNRKETFKKPKKNT